MTTTVLKVVVTEESANGDSRRGGSEAESLTLKCCRGSSN